MGTADVFNECSRSYGSKIPFNYFGSQMPYDSSGYVGALVTKDGEREYLTQELRQPLLKDSTYHIQLWVSLANLSLWATDSVGVGFTAMEPQSNTVFSILCDTL